ncbi:hypothetical protein OAO87_04795 [bacterium]|nr:hypothetical protein [bacterium]
MRVYAARCAWRIPLWGAPPASEQPGVVPIRHPDKLLLADPKERSGYAVVRRYFDGRLRKNVDGRVATARSRKTLHRAGEC